MDELIISSAHELMLALPVKDHILVCIQCGDKGKIAHFKQNSQTCHPHIELKSSGWGGVPITEAN